MNYFIKTVNVHVHIYLYHILDKMIKIINTRTVFIVYLYRIVRFVDEKVKFK